MPSRHHKIAFPARGRIRLETDPKGFTVSWTEPRPFGASGVWREKTLILHAENDTIIPIRDAEMLFNACSDSAKVFLRVPHAGHNDIQFRAGRRYFDAIRALLGRLGGTGAPRMPS